LRAVFAGGKRVQSVMTKGPPQVVTPWDDLTSEMVLSRLSYDAATGVFRWAVDPGNALRKGANAGRRDPRGYIAVHLFGTHRLAHRLAWLVVHGRPIPAQIDHIDRDKSNNAIENLRAVNHSQNQFNAVARGYYYHSSDRKYQAFIKVNGRSRYIGRFETEEEARAAYVETHIRVAGEFSPYLRTDCSSTGDK
jgi:hypothetical protein